MTTLPLAHWKALEVLTPEQKLLLQYWHLAPGKLYTEVSVGGAQAEGVWPYGSQIHLIDAVRIPTAPAESDICNYDPHQHADAFAGIPQADAIACVLHLNRSAIGHALVGARLLAREFRLPAVHAVVVCKTAEPSLELVCREDLGVLVWKPGAPSA